MILTFLLALLSSCLVCTNPGLMVFVPACSLSQIFYFGAKKFNQGVPKHHVCAKNLHELKHNAFQERIGLGFRIALYWMESWDNFLAPPLVQDDMCTETMGDASHFIYQQDAAISFHSNRHASSRHSKIQLA